MADAAPAGSPEAAAAASAAEQIEALTSKSSESPLTVEMEAALATIAANPDLYHEAPEVLDWEAGCEAVCNLWGSPPSF